MYRADALADNVQHMKPVQCRTGFIFSSFLRLYTLNLRGLVKITEPYLITF